jgi:hypothetical protein
MAVRAMQQAAAMANATETSVATSDEAIEFTKARPTAGMARIFAMSACPKLTSSRASGKITDIRKKHPIADLMNPRVLFSCFVKE